MKSIDLHGTKHEDVSKLLDAFLWSAMQKKESSVIAITGNSSEMKRIVKDTISDYGFSSDEDFLNSGILIIKIR